MVYEIRCKIFPGQFSNEFAVACDQWNGESFSLFAPRKNLSFDEEPTREKSVDGWLKVTLWELAGDRAVVKLPRESFESGRFVTVNLMQFKVRPEPVEA